MKLIKKENLIFEINWNIYHTTKGNYIHITPLALAFGSDGFILFLPVISISATWGEASFKNYHGIKPENEKSK